jgi:uncharacterized protein YceK
MRISLYFKMLTVVYSLLIAIAILLSGCGSTIKFRAHRVSGPEAVKFIEAHIDFYSKELRMGTPRSVVLSYLPKPDNTNIGNVCVWVSKSTETVVTTNRSDWQWLQATRGGYFLVFVDDKLATPLCANAAFTLGRRSPPIKE